MKNIKVVILKEDGKVVEEYLEERTDEEVEIFSFEKDPYEKENINFYNNSSIKNKKTEKMVEFYY